MKNIITILLFICGMNAGLWAQGWTQTWYQQGGITGAPAATSNEVIETIPFTNNEFLSVYRYPFQHTELFRFFKANENGLSGGTGIYIPTDSIQYFPKSILASEASDSTVIVLAEIGPYNQPAKAVHLIKKVNLFNDISLNLAFNVSIFPENDMEVKGTDFALTPNENFIVLGAVKSEEVAGNENVFDLVVVEADSLGIPIWTQQYASIGNDIPVEIIPDGDEYLILKNKEQNGVFQLVLLRIDAEGEILSETSISNTIGYQAKDIISANDGGYIITGENEQQNLFVLKLDANENTVWQVDYDASDKLTQGRAVAETSEGQIVVVGVAQNLLTEEEPPLLAKLSANGSPIWERYHIETNTSRAGYNSVVITEEGNFIMTGYRQKVNSDREGAYFVKTDTFGIIKGGLIKGNIFHDTDADCINVDELNLEDWVVQAQYDTLYFYGNADELGNYSIPVDIHSSTLTYDYTVSVTPPNNYWEACENDIIVPLNYLDTATVNLAMQATVECPFMTTQLGTSGIRPCEENTISVEYCNEGTSIAEDVTIEIVLDNRLTYQDGSIVPAAIDEQVLTYELGNLGINQCGNFEFQVFTDCDSIELGDIVCIDFYTTPDTICGPMNAAWSGALLQSNVICDEENMQFKITNTGTGAMANPLEFIIIEDAVLLSVGEIDLEPGQDVSTELLPINGSVYHIIAPQEPNAPGGAWISLGNIDCDNYNDAFFDEVQQNGGHPFASTLCQPVIGSFDPNDKQVSPSGITENNYILPNTDLDYKIRFQNTGTDSAFRVVIRDVLSEHLDPMTFNPGPASHDYEWHFEEREVVFNFYNIALPDSTTNLAESQGFVTFNIAQQTDLAIGTPIQNEAAIYFDFNAPIITNQTQQLVHQFVQILNKTVQKAPFVKQITIAPNPMQNGAWISILGAPNNQTIALDLFDVSGKKVHAIEGQGDRIWLPRGNLSAGMYFFSINNTEGWLANGKLIIH